MSYLELPEGVPDFTRAVISLWFRVPQSTIDAAVLDTGQSLLTIIPLLTWGKPQTKIQYESIIQDIAVWHYTPGGGTFPIMEQTGWAATAHDPVNPCYIGLQCKVVDNVVVPRVALTFNIQTGDYMSIAAASTSRSQVDLWSSLQMPSVDMSPGSGYETIGGSVRKSTLVDLSYVNNAQPEVFLVRTVPEMAPDHWHHLLLSFDLSGSCVIGQPNPTTSCKLWYAIDDVDYREATNLRPYRYVGDGLGSNDILNENTYFLSGGSSAPSLFHNYYVGPTSGHYHPAPIPSHGEKLGIPAAAGYINDISAVELAEFQLFAGVTLDTNVESNRRAFIDENGKPVSPTTTPDDPSDPHSPKHTPAERLLGTRPEILLHGSSNWIAGKNTGPTIINPDYNPDAPEGPNNPSRIPDPDKQFTPTGKIVAYTPDPSLHGAQSSPAPAPARAG